MANYNFQIQDREQKEMPCRKFGFVQDTPLIMKKLTTPRVLALLCLCSPLFADTGSSIEKILSVDSEGTGNDEASKAWQTLSGGDGESIIEILTALDKANSISANWLRSAVDAIAQKQKDQLPLAQLHTFLADQKHNPRARRLAYELIRQANPQQADKLIAGMLNDPSVELRRDAVQRVLNQAKEKNSTELYQKALDSARDLDQINQAKDALVEAGKEVDLPRHFGFLMHWKVIGPFDNTGREGFNTVYPPEEEIDFSKSYPGKSGTVQWTDHQTADIYGMVDINEPYGHLKEVVAYAHHTYNSSECRPAEIRLGCKNAWKIWHNGKLVFERDEYHRGMRIDQYTLPIDLIKGSNTFLIKLCQNEQKESWTDQWQFQLRICDSTGTAILADNRLPTPQPKEPTRRPRKSN
jgi:hypothetical protein